MRALRGPRPAQVDVLLVNPIAPQRELRHRGEVVRRAPNPKPPAHRLGERLHPVKPIAAKPGELELGRRGVEALEQVVEAVFPQPVELGEVLRRDVRLGLGLGLLRPIDRQRQHVALEEPAQGLLTRDGLGVVRGGGCRGGRGEVPRLLSPLRDLLHAKVKRGDLDIVLEHVHVVVVVDPA
ncbi:unnamed protein product [Phytomonas sp. Hart1]|nr:unnamed protein product [Phytomonas sp. Hart1]|eukprot:CCW70751.1 unnamed protein product [Phytomonas sp. isolate Hart1]